MFVSKACELFDRTWQVWFPPGFRHAHMSSAAAVNGHYGIRRRRHAPNPAVIRSDDTLPDRSVPQSEDQSSHEVVMDIYGLALVQVRNSMRAITTARDEDYYYSECIAAIDVGPALLRATALAAVVVVVLSMAV
ncbi:hypothetical protein [Agrobacterium sp. NPDC089420]|uniref:hypothetical protein n=1 Tax=Agrobacterium sp. NPDC089420 TaxID=3363918 RepID=UPI00384F55C0